MRTLKQYFTVLKFQGTACQPPFVELTMVRESTRSGLRTASLVATMPPILQEPKMLRFGDHYDLY